MRKGHRIINDAVFKTISLSFYSCRRIRYNQRRPIKIFPKINC